jgi:hypothetical protein
LHRIILGVLRVTVERAQSTAAVRHSFAMLHTALAFLAFALRTPVVQDGVQDTTQEVYSGIHADVLIGSKEARRGHIVGLLAEIVQDSECSDQKVFSGEGS